MKRLSLKKNGARGQRADRGPFWGYPNVACVGPLAAPVAHGLQRWNGEVGRAWIATDVRTSRGECAYHQGLLMAPLPGAVRDPLSTEDADRADDDIDDEPMPAAHGFDGHP